MIFVKGFYQGVEFGEDGQPGDTFLLVLSDGADEVAAEINEESFHELRSLARGETSDPPAMTAQEPMEVDGGPMEVDLYPEDTFYPPEDPVPQPRQEEASDDFDSPPNVLFSHDVGDLGEVSGGFGGDGGIESV